MEFSSYKKKGKEQKRRESKKNVVKHIQSRGYEKGIKIRMKFSSI